MGVARTEVRTRNVAGKRRPAASVAARLAQTEDASRERSVHPRPVAQLTTVVSTPTIDGAIRANSAALETCRDLLHAAETGHLLRRPPVEEASIPERTESVPSPARHGANGTEHAGMRQARVELHGIRNPANQSGDDVRADVVAGPNLTAPAHDLPARQQRTCKPSAHTDFDRIENTIDGSWSDNDGTCVCAPDFAMVIAPPTGDASRLSDGAALVLAHRHMNRRGKAGNHLGLQTKLQRAVPELTGAVFAPTGDSPVLLECTAMSGPNGDGLSVGKPIDGLRSGDQDGRFREGIQGLTPASDVATREQCANRSTSRNEIHSVRQSNHSTRLKSWDEGASIAQSSPVTPTARAAVHMQRASIEATGRHGDDICGPRTTTRRRRQFQFGASAAAEGARNHHHHRHGSKHDVVLGSRPRRVAHPTPQRIAAQNGEPR